MYAVENSFRMLAITEMAGGRIRVWTCLLEKGEHGNEAKDSTNLHKSA